MFRSKTRNIIIPQSEHSRLAGAIAALWGNDSFDKPPFSFDAFVAGVTLHDHGHGYFDMDDIGSREMEAALESMRRLVNHQLDDPIVATVASFHALRLLHLDAAWSGLIDQCEQQIAAGIQRTRISRDSYLWADRITNLCDSIAFDFCFEQPLSAEVEIYPRQGQTDPVKVRYDLDRHGKIVIEPWPLSVDSYEGFILGYEAETYPDTLKPVLVYYVLSK
jgi:hypothetical protein